MANSHRRSSAKYFLPLLVILIAIPLWYLGSQKKATSEGVSDLGKARILYICARYTEHIKADTGRAIKIYRAAARTGYLPAMSRAAALSRENITTVEGFQIAAITNELAASYGDGNAAYFVGTLVKEGLLNSTKSSQAWFLLASGHDNAAALYQLGNLAELRGDVKDALGWYESAASKGDAKSKLALADAFMFGKGVDVDTEKSIEYMHEAARDGHLIAQYNYAKILEAGTLVDQDLASAGHWYQQSADKGLQASLYKISLSRQLCLDTAEPMARINLEACLIAQNTRNPFILFKLGNLYANGQHFRRDDQRAFLFYKKAAYLGHPAAALLVAESYFRSIGVKKNNGEAIAWTKAIASSALMPDDISLSARELLEKSSDNPKLFDRIAGIALYPKYKGILEQDCILTTLWRFDLMFMALISKTAADDINP